MEILFLPFQIFQMVPALALLPALAMAVLLLSGRHKNTQRPTRIAVSCIVLWIAYALWEYRVQIWAETETAPIRVDLLLIGPLLIINTLWSCIVLVRWRRRSG